MVPIPRSKVSDWIDHNIGRILIIVVMLGIGMWGIFLDPAAEYDTVKTVARRMSVERARCAG